MTNQTDPAALVKAALDRAALCAENTATCILPSGHFLSERCRDAIRALADDPKAVVEIVEQAKGENDE